MCVKIFSFLAFNPKFMNKVVNLSLFLSVIGRTFYSINPLKYWDYSKLSVGKKYLYFFKAPVT